MSEHDPEVPTRLCTHPLEAFEPEHEPIDIGDAGGLRMQKGRCGECGTRYERRSYPDRAMAGSMASGGAESRSATKAKAKRAAKKRGEG